MFDRFCPKWRFPFVWNTTWSRNILADHVKTGPPWFSIAPVCLQKANIV